MKAIIAIASLCVALPLARACWAAVSLQDLVKGRHLIVVGQIQRISNAPRSRYSFDTAFIKVERILRSSFCIATNAEVPLSIPSINNEIQSSTDIHYSKGQRGIWMLYYQDGRFYAWHPMALQPLSEEQNVLAAMNAQKVK